MIFEIQGRTLQGYRKTEPWKKVRWTDTAARDPNRIPPEHYNPARDDIHARDPKASVGPRLMSNFKRAGVPELQHSGAFLSSNVCKGAPQERELKIYSAMLEVLRGRALHCISLQLCFSHGWLCSPYYMDFYTL